MVYGNPTNYAVFQSLRGFGVGWSDGLISYPSILKGFQSLRGFGVGWSGAGDGSRGAGECFNP